MEGLTVVPEKIKAVRNESAAERFLDKFEGRPEDFYSHLGVERHEGRLDNGLTVVWFKKPGEKVNIIFSSIGGGRSDPEGLMGRAHFNEHLVLAGTSEYPRKDLLVRPIEREGGEMGAATGNERIYIHTSLASPSDLRLAVDIASKCLSDSLFLPDTIENERGSVLQEMAIKETDQKSNLFPVYQKAFLAGTPLENPILGTKESVSRMTREELMSQGEEMFVGERMAIVGAGNVPFERVMEDISHAFGTFRRGRKMGKAFFSSCNKK